MPPTAISRAFGTIALAAGLVCAALPASAQDDEFDAKLTELGNTTIRQIAENPVLVAAINAQNLTSAAYDQKRIDDLDAQWQSEVGAASHPLIDATLGTPASQWLMQVQEEAAGIFSEIFVMDARGLNVAQSTITSDYWQGDEDKFTMSYGAGIGAVHLGEIEQDESTQAFQSQVSITITDPATGLAIGALTAGVDLSMI